MTLGASTRAAPATAAQLRRLRDERASCGLAPSSPRATASAAICAGTCQPGPSDLVVHALRDEVPGTEQRLKLRERGGYLPGMGLFSECSRITSAAIFFSRAGRAPGTGPADLALDSVLILSSAMAFFVWKSMKPVTLRGRRGQVEDPSQSAGSASTPPVEAELAHRSGSCPARVVVRAVFWSPSFRSSCGPTHSAAVDHTRARANRRISAAGRGWPWHRPWRRLARPARNAHLQSLGSRRSR